jgi:hypothetical protein
MTFSRASLGRVFSILDITFDASKTSGLPARLFCMDWRKTRLSSRASSSTEALMTTLNKSMCQRHADRAAAQEIRPQNFAFAHAEGIDMSMTRRQRSMTT